MLRLSIFLSLIAVAQATLNGACTVGSTPGVCLATATCSAGGGTSTSGFCIGDPTDVKCCTKTSCGSGGLCPGPTDFKCCLPASGCAPPTINAATVSLIKQFEGFVASPAPDPIGLPTVGYGHLCQTTNCGEVPFKFPLTEAQATTLLMTDIKTYTKCVADDIVDSVRLNDNQFGALSSWAFNEGCGAVKTSTLIARLNNGENPNTVAAQELPKWNIAGGQVLPGLTRRRAAEVTLFQTPSSIIAHPPPC
ncbi:glycoside hydrolase family 24 protein [Crucibulum laeve]|uniref:Glycoside hydrolase family 24 protein n=1 Tax=Crucibulum laeve TaxID=68775 RepID=A0A5C3LZT2_9AGAR|nr:glycoside hydrolase family 24 protein [Crucibulum laeve]